MRCHLGIRAFHRSLSRPTAQERAVLGAIYKERGPRVPGGSDGSGCGGSRCKLWKPKVHQTPPDLASPTLMIRVESLLPGPSVSSVCGELGLGWQRHQASVRGPATRWGGGSGTGWQETR